MTTQSPAKFPVDFNNPDVIRDIQNKANDPQFQQQIQQQLKDPNFIAQIESNPQMKENLDKFIKNNPDIKNQISNITGKLGQNLAQNMINKIVQEKINEEMKQDEESFLTKHCGCFSLDRLKPYFDVTTDLVKERIKASLNPLNDTFFSIGAKADAYGPMWVNTSLIFILGACGNLSALLVSDNYTYDFSFLPTAASIIYGCGILVPVLMCYLMRSFGSEQMEYLKVICIYGYANVIYCLVVFLCALPFGMMQWLLMIYGCLHQTCFLLKNFTEELDKYAPERKKSFQILILVIQGCLVIIYKLYFFSVIVAKSGTGAFEYGFYSMINGQPNQTPQQEHPFLNQHVAHQHIFNGTGNGKHF